MIPPIESSSWRWWSRTPLGVVGCIVPWTYRCRELGREGLEAFQETKHVHMESKIERKECGTRIRSGAG